MISVYHLSHSNRAEIANDNRRPSTHDIAGPSGHTLFSWRLIEWWPITAYWARLAEQRGGPDQRADRQKCRAAIGRQRIVITQWVRDDPPGGLIRTRERIRTH